MPQPKSLIGAILVTAVILVTALTLRPKPPAPNGPTAEPAAHELAGTYRTTDPRSQGATIQIAQDGRLTFTNPAGQSSDGRWTLQRNYVGHWELMVDYNGTIPDGATSINRPLEGQHAPFAIHVPLDERGRTTAVFRKTD